MFVESFNEFLAHKVGSTKCKKKQHNNNKQLEGKK